MGRRAKIILASSAEGDKMDAVFQCNLEKGMLLALKEAALLNEIQYRGAAEKQEKIWQDRLRKRR